ncbi:hypothetical protein RD792_001348 [Penstemon davidsonii]|uniref:Uncharacterized protein n=1 Tax=Penstemon davidsonii TaxID=160366 RepID=A0ABR0DNE2_9LAMI|nr:hypothetical protein RD792_001348 [Penstemon davidsonii]
MEAYGAANSNNKRRFTKCPWGREEDDILTAHVKTHGVGNWNYIADHIPGRTGCGFFLSFTGQSCRLRWFNQLDPKIDKSPFSEEEQQKLLQLQREYGNRWSTIVRFFPGRTDNQIKNQYHVLAGSQYTKASSPSSSITEPVGTPLNGGYIDLSWYRSTVSSFEVGSQFSNNSTGVAPHLADRIGTPLFSGGPSSVNAETWLAARSFNSFDCMSLGNVYGHLGASRGDFMMLDGNSAKISESCPVALPTQGADGGDLQFIDFLGVGTSE